jgi:hypothetical protein
MSFLGVVAQVCNPGTWEAEAEGLGVQGIDSPFQKTKTKTKIKCWGLPDHTSCDLQWSEDLLSFVVPR